MNVAYNENPEDPQFLEALFDASEYILDDFFADLADPSLANEPRRFGRFYKLILDKDQPVTESDYERLDVVGVALAR